MDTHGLTEWQVSQKSQNNPEK